MHYEERPLQKVEAGCGAASTALRCAATLPVERSTLSSWARAFVYVTPLVVG